MSVAVLVSEQVHTACMDLYPRKCPLGQCKVSIIPPTALNSIDSDGMLLVSILLMVFLKCEPSVVLYGIMYMERRHKTLHSIVLFTKAHLKISCTGQKNSDVKSCSVTHGKC